MTPMDQVNDVLSGTRQWAVLSEDCRNVFLMLGRRSVHHVIADFPFSAHVHGLQRRMLRGGGYRPGRSKHPKVSASDGKWYGDVGPASLGFTHLTEELRRFAARHAARVAQRWILLKADETTRYHWQTDLEAAGARHVRAGAWLKLGAQPQLSGDRPAVALEMLEIAHARGERLHWNGGGKHARWKVLPAAPAWEVPIATDRNGTGARVHATQTPLELWLQLLADFTDHGEAVFDPCCGSGSLGIACARLGRRYIGTDNGCDWGQNHQEGPPCPHCCGNIMAPHAGKSWAEWAMEGINAEAAGSTRIAHRVGQLGLFTGR